MQATNGPRLGLAQQPLHLAPGPLERVEVGGIGRQELQADTFRDNQIPIDVPTGAVEHEDDQIVRAGPDLPGEGGQDLAEIAVLSASARNQTPSPAAGRTKPMP